MSISIISLCVAGILFWKLKQAKADYDQAIFSAYRLLMLSNNGGELHEQMESWTRMGLTMAASGETISEGNKRVMKINTAILKGLNGKDWLVASEEYRNSL
ncbi:hypothetical protein SynA1562_00968 [Synechococcus sp. A15-62]|uniref:hypothetical protein n=1 Tax=Synechococcus sp. A15-62 TaxID=1050657 RepID=UPI001644D68A|nr:hypothetical protein [Synechococcus sp. A15-62]QNI99802.1 hypothetical protein SynA1562_00968 [Synechococcus sp. A15-62]